MVEKDKSKCNMSMKYWRLSVSYVYCTIYTTVFFCFIYITISMYIDINMEDYQQKPQQS